jgi:hypothetical protein
MLLIPVQTLEIPCTCNRPNPNPYKTTMTVFFTDKRTDTTTKNNEREKTRDRELVRDHERDIDRSQSLPTKIPIGNVKVTETGSTH